MIWPLTGGGSASLSLPATLFDPERFEADLIVMTDPPGLPGESRKAGQLESYAVAFAVAPLKKASKSALIWSALVAGMP